jgi:hypothetical protein
MTGIHDHRIERFAGVLDWGSVNRAAPNEHDNKCKGEETADQTQHSLLIAKNEPSGKISVSNSNVRSRFVSAIRMFPVSRIKCACVLRHRA